MAARRASLFAALVAASLLSGSAMDAGAKNQKALEESLRQDLSHHAGMATAHGKGKSGKATLQILGKSHAEKHRPASDNVQANSMSPHLSMHSTRGQQAGEARRGRGGGRPSSYWRRAPIIKGGKVYQKTQYGMQALPPDEATPFFDTYVLEYAFPTIAVICSCLACVLFRTMRMYQKERWKGTSYFHGARRSAESLIPGNK